MLRIGWFATARGETSPKLLRAFADEIRAGRLDADISFVFSNREPGEFPITDRFFELVHGLGLPLVTLSDRRFRKECGGEVAKSGQPLPSWRADYDCAVVELLAPFEYDIGLLAGYMLIMTPPLFETHPMLNLHPAAPGQPEGTWQQVIWKLIDQKADYAGARIHLTTAGLDEGPIVTYCTYPMRGPSIDPLWKQAEGRTAAEIQAAEGEAFALFREIRLRGVLREPSLLVHTARALADGRLRIPDGNIFADGTRVTRGFDLSPEVEADVAAMPLA